MVRYSLTCADGHAFESWFASASAYDDLTGRATRLAGGAGPVQALERILRATPHEYDPGVVAALIRQLDRRGVLSTAQAASLQD